MIINENMKNELLAEAAEAIQHELIEFEDWVTDLDEYCELQANAEHVLSIEQLSCAKTKIEHVMCNHMFDGTAVDVDEYKTRYNALVEAERVITTASRTYSKICGYLERISTNVKNGRFNEAQDEYKKLRALRSETITNPLKGINVSAIGEEIRTARRECSKMDAFMESRQKNIENFREFFIESSAMVGWGATALAVVYTAAKILKK